MDLSLKYDNQMVLSFSFINQADLVAGKGSYASFKCFLSLAFSELFCIEAPFG